MSGVTVRLIFSVKGGAETWKQPLKAFLQAVQEHPGHLQTSWGPWTEDQQKVDIFIGWENKEAQASFEKSAAFKDAMGQLKPVLSGRPEHYFVNLFPAAPKEVGESPVVEVATITRSKASEEELRATAEKAKTQGGCNGVASGYSTDGSIFGKTFVAIIGWASMDASKAADKSSYTTAKAEVHHVSFNFAF